MKIALTSRRCGFTLVELLVLLGILLVIGSIFLPYVTWLRESNSRLVCADHLRQINGALKSYAGENRGAFPRTTYDEANNPNGWTAFTGPDSPDPFLDGSAVKPNDVTASLFLLIRTGKLESAGVFVCPSTDDRRDILAGERGQVVEPISRSNFRSADNLSYSYAHPFSIAPGYRLDEYRPAYFVLMADRNPGRSSGRDVTAVKETDGALSLARGNSKNHGGAGQNVLFASGAVEFMSTPFCGAGRGVSGSKTGDNIYTALRDKILEGEKPPADQPGVIGEAIGPAWYEDTYLVPYDR